MHDEISSAVAAIMAARPRFRVGDRVRVTGSMSECQWAWESDMPPGHPDTLIGSTGVVEKPPAHLARRAKREGHPIAVMLDVPIVVEGCTWWGSFYAPTELEHLTTSPAATPPSTTTTGEQGR